MSEISERHRVLAAEFARRVAAVPDDKWTAQSPCTGWTARDVLRHVLTTTYHDMPEKVGLSVPVGPVDTDPVAAVDAARGAMQKILDDPAQATLEYDGWFGRTTLECTVNDFGCFDLLIHAWDLARATGQDETMPADEVHRAYEAALKAGDMLRYDGVCGPEVSVPADAPEQDRLLGLLGRTP